MILDSQLLRVTYDCYLESTRLTTIQYNSGDEELFNRGNGLYTSNIPTVEYNSYSSQK